MRVYMHPCVYAFLLLIRVSFTLQLLLDSSMSS